MPADRVLVIDAGTSALRAMSVAMDGETDALATQPWPIDMPDDAAPFGREIDADALERAVTALVDASAGHGPFAAIATSGQREGLILADEALRPILVSPNIDGRASAEGMLLDAGHGWEIYHATGHLPSLMHAPAKLAWLRTHRPADAGRVRHTLPLADWIAARLAGKPVMSQTLGVENGVLAVRSAAPALHLAEAGFHEGLLPPIEAEGSVIGSVAAGALSGAPVVLAGADTQCALVGMGVLDDGECGVPAGWSAPLQIVTAAPVFDEQMRTWTGRHVLLDRFVLESNAGETGRAWGWVCDLLGVTPHEAAALAASAPVGSHDVTIVLGGRAMRASGMTAGIGGVLVPLPLVMSSPSRADVVRAVLESVAFALRSNLEQLEEVTGARPACLRLGGGMSRMALFAQMIADVIDRPVEVARTPETTALGAAALASVAIGVHRTLEDATSAMCGGRARFEPDLRSSTEYEDRYDQWCAMADAMERAGGEGV